jgi:hypothetical protein
MIHFFFGVTDDGKKFHFDNTNKEGIKVIRKPTF